MLLAIDVGNTNTVIGLYRQNKLLHMWRVGTNRSQTADELRLVLHALMHSENLNFEEVRGVALASVVPQLSQAWNRVSMALFNNEAIQANAQTAGKLFSSSYPNPEEIGADRIADAVAAKALYGFPCVVVDFGTATNIEVIDNKGNFLGGVIAPGVDTSAQALFASAARLSAIELVDPGTAIGTSTDAAVQAGIVYGEAARVDGLVDRIFDQLGYQAPVIATGGLAQRVARYSKTITETNTQLTLEGLRRICDEVTKN